MVMLADLLPEGKYESLGDIDLDRDKYGFQTDRSVQISPSQLGLTLSPQAVEVYQRLIRSGTVSINNLLESVGFIINDSIEYDYDGLISVQRDYGSDTSRTEKEQRDYTPTGNEKMKGLCHDAGKLIRQLFQSLQLDERYQFIRVTCPELPNGTINHDTTLFVDLSSGEWAVVNSKYPVHSFNLVPEERLSELGRPYTTIMSQVPSES
jgi:hypothetical protein